MSDDITDTVTEAPVKLKLGDEFNKKVTKDTLKKKLPTWTKYTFANAKKIMQKCERKGTSLRSMSVEMMRPILVAKPCLVIGWGNSFHETLDLIKELPRDKINIVSCDRPLRKLIENGIVPDLIVNLDSGPQIRPFYKVGLPERDILKLKIALAITTDPKEVMWFHGQKYWYIPAITPWDNELTKETSAILPYPVLPTAGNVGTTAVMISKICGAGPIFLIGFDFGREVFGEHDSKATTENLCTSKDMEITFPSGRKFISDPVLHAYAHAFRRLLIYYDLNVVNLSGGLLHGPYIKTMEPHDTAGGNSRLRMKTLIEEIKKWEMPEKNRKFREGLLSGKLKLSNKDIYDIFFPKRRLSQEEYDNLNSEDRTIGMGVIADAAKQ